MQSKGIVRLENLSMTYHSREGEIKALDNISLDVMEEDFIGIVGPSGCGKSTILSLIAGLIKPTAGRILVEGKPINGPSSLFGYMLQQDHLFEWRTILQNVMLGLEIRGNINRESRDRAERLLETYGLGEFKHRYPNHLSGGMRQRAALIRTLAIDPKILLLDEPFSALDYQTRLAISVEVAAIIKKEKKTALLVTHDISEAISMSNRVIVLTNRPASIKNSYEIKLTCKEHNPISCRQAPEFREYFNSIWKELDIHVG